MLAEVLRIIVAAYFLFSGSNKVFFFDRVSEYVASFFELPAVLGTALAVVVIALELLFVMLVLFWNGKLIPRIFALALAIPFIIYNVRLFFVLGLENCNCMYGSTGESITSPIFSIIVLLITVAAVFYFTHVHERRMPFPARIVTIVIVGIMTVGYNAIIWNDFQTNPIVALRQMVADQAKTEITEYPPYEVFIQLPKGRPSRRH